MATTQGNNTGNKANLKDEIINDIHQGILEVQQASDGANSVGNDKPEPGEHPAAEPEELLTKRPEVEPEKDL